MCRDNNLCRCALQRQCPLKLQVTEAARKALEINFRASQAYCRISSFLVKKSDLSSRMSCYHYRHLMEEIHQRSAKHVAAFTTIYLSGYGIKICLTLDPVCHVLTSRIRLLLPHPILSIQSLTSTNTYQIPLQTFLFPSLRALFHAHKPPQQV